MGSTHRVTLIPGDGVGPELTEATRRVLEAAAATAGSSFDWDRQEAGVDNMETAGTPLPPAVLDSIRDTKIAIKGPITTPIGTGFRSVNVALRAELDLYACLRPCKTYPGVRSRFDHVDVVIVRENTEDLYAGIEYEHDTDAANKVIEFCNTLQAKQIRPHSGISIKPMSEFGSARVIRYAFQYAQGYGRQRVHCITKSNIMKHTDGLFLAVFREVAKDFPDIEPRENLVDATCMGLVQRPEEWDVLVLPNLYGDILSDLTAGMVGGLGVAPGANFGTEVAQHQHSGQDHGGRVDLVLPLVLGRRPVRRLEHGHLGAEVGARGHPQPAHHAGGQVGEDVAVEVGQHKNVPLLRPLHQAHAGRVDEVLPRLDVREVLGHLAEHREEQPVGVLHDVGLGDAVHSLAAVALGVLERIPDDPRRPELAHWLDRDPGVRPDLLGLQGVAELDHLVGRVGVVLVLDPGVQILGVLPH